MSSLRCVCARYALYLLVVVVLLGIAAPGRADPKPLSKEEQAKIDKAIDKAIAFLKKTQMEDGDWPGPNVRNRYWQLGYTLLAAYALLEAGVPADDPVIKKAAVYIRANLPKTDKTYEVSLGVLFLDRLADPKDEKLIRSLALRLIVGQHGTGGWTYHCFPQGKVKEVDEEALLKLLGAVGERLETGKEPTAQWLKDLNVPREMQSLPVFQDPRKLPRRDPPPPKRGNVDELADAVGKIPYTAGADNSNTQFALLALWVARRHKLPLRPTFDLLVLRFERMQAADGGWPYSYTNFDGLTSRGRRSMTCVGLLALAISRGLQFPSHAGSLSGKSLPAQPGPSAGRRKSSRQEKPLLELDDARIHMGLAELYRQVGVPTGQMDKRVPLQDYYFLWSLERVAMLYNLPSFADKEWYRWGAEILVTNQGPSGESLEPGKGDRQTGWQGLSAMDYGSMVNTAFALLFLKRSHPMKELTPKLPFKPEELNKSIMRLTPKGDTLDRPATSPGQSRNPDR